MLPSSSISAIINNETTSCSLSLSLSLLVVPRLVSCVPCGCDGRKRRIKYEEEHRSDKAKARNARFELVATYNGFLTTKFRIPNIKNPLIHSQFMKPYPIGTLSTTYGGSDCYKGLKPNPNWVFQPSSQAIYIPFRSSFQTFHTHFLQNLIPLRFDHKTYSQSFNHTSLGVFIAINGLPLLKPSPISLLLPLLLQNAHKNTMGEALTPSNLSIFFFGFPFHQPPKLTKTTRQPNEQFSTTI